MTDEPKARKARKKTSKTKFTSNYGANGPITAAQKIVEILCERAAARDHKKLTDKFWETKDWKSFFLMQLIQANKLLKQFSPEAIIAALNNRKAARFFSLRLKAFVDVIESEQAKITAFEKQAEAAEPAAPLETTVEAPRTQPQVKRSNLSKLKDL